MRQSVIRSVYPVALFIHYVGGDDFSDVPGLSSLVWPSK